MNLGGIWKINRQETRKWKTKRKRTIKQKDRETEDQVQEMKKVRGEQEIRRQDKKG